MKLKNQLKRESKRIAILSYISFEFKVFRRVYVFLLIFTRPGRRTRTYITTIIRINPYVGTTLQGIGLFNTDLVIFVDITVA